MTTWELDIARESLDAIIRRIKVYEGRAPDGSNPKKDYRKIKPGDTIEFYLVNEDYRRVSELPMHIREVEESITFKDVASACDGIDLQRFNPGINIVEENVQLYNSFPGYPERIKKYGFTRIKLKIFN